MYHIISSEIALSSFKGLKHYELLCMMAHTSAAYAWEEYIAKFSSKEHEQEHEMKMKVVLKLSLEAPQGQSSTIHMLHNKIYW